MRHGSLPGVHGRVRPLTLLGDPVLHTPCGEVTDFGPELADLVDQGVRAARSQTIKSNGRTGVRGKARRPGRFFASVALILPGSAAAPRC